MGQIRVMRIIARMNVGGPAVEISGLMRHLDATRFEQRLVTGWCDAHEEDYLTTQAPDIPSTRIEGLGRAVRPTDDARAFGALVREIRRFRPHIIHTHTAKAGALGRAAAVFAPGNPIVVHTYHGHVLSGYFSPAKTRAIVQVERTLGHRTDAFITVGAQVRDELLAAGIGNPEKFTVIPPGLTVRSFPTREHARAELDLAADAQVVSVVGRITGIKRPDRVADVAAALKQTNPSAIIVMAGSGDLEPELRERVEREHLPIRLLGWREDVERIFAASDLTLLTSDNEGTPLSLIQAAMGGVPCVATNVGAVHEIVEDGVTGLLTATDSEALAQATRQLLDDDEKRDRLGTAARTFAESRFTVQRFADAHAEVYNSQIALRRSSK